MLPIPGTYSGQLTKDELYIFEPKKPFIEPAPKVEVKPTNMPVNMTMTDTDAKGLSDEDDDLPAYITGVLTWW